MSDLGSYKSNINPIVEATIRIAANSKTDRVCSSEKERNRENTRECINAMDEARKTASYEEVARRVTEKLDRKRIEERKDRDWGAECIERTRLDDSEKGDER